LENDDQNGSVWENKNQQEAERNYELFMDHLLDYPADDANLYSEQETPKFKPKTA